MSEPASPATPKGPILLPNLALNEDVDFQGAPMPGAWTSSLNSLQEEGDESMLSSCLSCFCTYLACAFGCLQSFIKAIAESCGFDLQAEKIDRSADVRKVMEFLDEFDPTGAPLADMMAFRRLPYDVQSKAIRAFEKAYAADIATEMAQRAAAPERVRICSDPVEQLMGENIHCEVIVKALLAWRDEHADVSSAPPSMPSTPKAVP